MFKNFLRKRELKKLYRHIPKEARNKVLTRTESFDRIGPIRILSEINSSIYELTLFHYTFFDSGNQYFLITRNNSLSFTNPVMRISSNCFYSYIANSRRCDCRWQLNYSYELLVKHDNDDFLIIFSVDDHGKAIEGGLRGHALLYALGQELGQELIVEAYESNGFVPDGRNYYDIDLILRSLSVERIRLLTNNPSRIDFFRSRGYAVEHIAIEKAYDKYLCEELGVKRQKLGHMLKLDGFKEEDMEIYGLSKESLKP